VLFPVCGKKTLLNSFTSLTLPADVPIFQLLLMFKLNRDAGLIGPCARVSLTLAPAECPRPYCRTLAAGIVDLFCFGPLEGLFLYNIWQMI